MSNEKLRCGHSIESNEDAYATSRFVKGAKICSDCGVKEALEKKSMVLPIIEPATADAINAFKVLGRLEKEFQRAEAHLAFCVRQVSRGEQFALYYEKTREWETQQEKKMK